MTTLRSSALPPPEGAPRQRPPWWARILMALADLKLGRKRPNMGPRR